MYEDDGDDEQVIDFARANRALKDTASEILNDSLEEILGRGEMIHADSAYYELMSEMQDRLKAGGHAMNVADIEKFMDKNSNFRKEFERAVARIEDMIGDQEAN